MHENTIPTIEALSHACNSVLKKSDKALAVWPSYAGIHRIGVDYACLYGFSVLNVVASEHIATDIESLGKEKIWHLGDSPVKGGVCVISIQKLSKHPELMEEIRKAQLDLVLFFDAHKMLGKSYEPAVTQLLKMKNIRKKLAISPTPFRDDGMGLGAFFGNIAYYSDVLEQMRCGLMRRISVQERDAEANNTLITHFCNEQKQTIIYTSSASEARRINIMLGENGIASALLLSSMKRKSIDDTIASFVSERVRVVCNYGVMAERSESSSAQRVMLLRNITSTSYLSQIINAAVWPKESSKVEIVDLFGNDVIGRLKQMRSAFTFEVVERKDRVSSEKKGAEATLEDTAFKELPIVPDSEAKKLLVDVGDYYILPLGFSKRFCLFTKSLSVCEIIDEEKIEKIGTTYLDAAGFSVWLKSFVEANKDVKTYEVLLGKKKSNPSAVQRFYIEQLVAKDIIDDALPGDGYSASAAMTYGFYTAKKRHIKLDYMQGDKRQSNHRIKIENDGSVIGAISVEEVLAAFGEKRVYIESKRLYRLFVEMHKVVSEGRKINYDTSGDVHRIETFTYTVQESIDIPLLRSIEGFCLKHNITLKGTSK